jgi:ribose transport system permease protein
MTPTAKTNSAALPFIERFALVGAWLAVIAGFSIALPDSFLSWGNFSVMFTTQAPLAILALALIVPLTAGDYDLSVGATVTLSGILIGALNVWNHMPIGWVILIVLLTGALVGAINAFFVVVVRIPSLVVTLGTASLITGLVQWISGSATIGGISPWLIANVVENQLFGISYAFYYALIATALLWYVFTYTPLGQRLLFVGRGREVARLVGISVNRVRAGCLIASSALAALAGVLYAGILGAADPVSGINLLLPAFAAAYLGATSIVPGRFNAWGAFIAVYFLSSGITGLSMMGIPLWVTNVFNGGALILAVTLSQFARGREQSDLG